MKLKTIITVLLLVFVATGLVYAVYKETGRGGGDRPLKETSQTQAADSVNASTDTIAADPAVKISQDTAGLAIPDKVNSEADANSPGNAAPQEGKPEASAPVRPAVDEIVAGDPEKTEDLAPPADDGRRKTVQKVIVYYFYALPRCVSCRNIESFTKEAVETNFSSELKAGTLEWKPVDIQQPGNEHFVDDYQLFSKSVVLVEFENEERKRYENLVDVWRLLDDRPAFIEYVKTSIESYLEAGD